MLFDPVVLEAEMPAIRRRFFDIVDDESWLDSYCRLGNRVEQNRLLRPYIHEYHYLECAFADFYLQQNDPSGIDGPTIDENARYRFAAFMAQVARVHQRLTPFGKNKLSGAIRRGLKHNLISIEHEISTSTQLMNKGFEVKFVDFENKHNTRIFDFIARKEGLEIEVECKSFSGDIGRKVHRESAAWIFKACECAMLKMLSNSNHKMFIVEVIFDETITRPSTYPSTISKIMEALEFGSKESIEGDGVALILTYFDDVDLPRSLFDGQMETDQIFKAVLETKYGPANNHFAFVAGPPDRVGAVVLRSAKDDTAIDSIVSQAKSAAKQLTGKRPGIIYGRLVDVSANGLIEVVNLQEKSKADVAAGADFSRPPLIQIETSKVLNSERYAHVHTIAYCSRGGIDAYRHPENKSLTVRSETGSVLTYRNSRNEFANDSRLNLFGTAYPAI